MTTACVVVLSLASCTKKSTNIERLSILPANLLISDPSSEWLKTAVPLAIDYDLMTAHEFVPRLAPDEAGAAARGATRLLRTSIESRQGGLHLEASIVDVATQKVIRVVSSDASSASVVLPAVNALAKKIDANAVEFSTKITPAWQLLTTAEANNNPQQRAQFLNQAINRDANFGLAWVSLLEMIVPNRQGELKKMIDEGKSHRAAFSPFDRAKFDVALNRLSNAPAAEQIKAAQAVLTLAPNELDVMTTLGNYQILAGDAAGGEQSLRRAVALDPASVERRFQLARGLMELRKFKDADTILTSLDKTPALYPELATVVLLGGDKARATGIIEKFVGTLPKDEFKTFVRAAWAVESGDRQKGIDLVLGAKFQDANFQALALGEASIWQMMGGDYAGAQKTIVTLTKTLGAQPSPLPVLLALLADKSSPAADWQKKVLSVGMPDSMKDFSLAYGYFLRGDYSEAAKAWQQLVDVSHGADLHARAMLASSLDHAGNKSEAGKIQVLPFSPEATDLYSAISFAEMRRMLPK